MLSWIALACLAGAVILLVILSIVDMRTRLLPNEMVAGFATLGLLFHLTTLAAFIPMQNIALGGVVGFSSLYLIRALANKIYDQDALGLGDVKLMGAGGLWLGPDAILLAMSAGAFAGLLHGLAYGLWRKIKHGEKVDFARLQLPAGPGFAFGLFAVGAWTLRHFRPEAL